MTLSPLVIGILISPNTTLVIKTEELWSGLQGKVPNLFTNESKMLEVATDKVLCGIVSLSR